MASRSIVRISLSIFISTCFAGNLIGTYFLFHVSTAETLQLICFYGVGAGLILGQVALLAIWGMLSVETLIIRLPRALALSILVLYSWLLGAGLSDPNLPVEGSIVISGLGMLLFLLLTAPLWIVRWISQHRIVTPGQIEIPRGQFTLRHIFIWTAVVAGMTGLGKSIIQFQSRDSIGMPPVGILIQMIVIVAAISLFVALLGLPMMWGVLTNRPSILGLSVVLAVLCLGPPILHESIYMVLGKRPSFDDRVTGFVGWYGFTVGAVAMTGGGLLLARALGFRFLPVRARAMKYTTM